MHEETVIKSTEMFFQEGSSDKLYNATLVQTPSGAYTLRVAWGKRGSPLKNGTKALEVSLEAAEKALAKVIRQKSKKGYEVRTVEHVPAEVAPPEGQGSGSKVAGSGRQRLPQKAQLLNIASDDELEALLADEQVIAQQKLDGKRLLVHIREGEVVSTNRDGFVTTAPTAITEALAASPAGTIVDGELMKSTPPTYWLFDLLSYGEEDLRGLSYRERYARLAAAGLTSESVVIVPSVEEPSEKRRLYERLRDQRAEGVVFKAAAAPYTGGRSASGGPQRKYKFVKTADVVITKNAGNAYQMALLFDASLREVGKVFAGTTDNSRAELDRRLTAGESIVAEVKYLYATDDDILFQPVFVRLRDDKPAEDCLSSQLIHTNRDGLTGV